MIIIDQSRMKEVVISTTTIVNERKITLSYKVAVTGETPSEEDDNATKYQDTKGWGSGNVTFDGLRLEERKFGKYDCPEFLLFEL